MLDLNRVILRTNAVKLHEQGITGKNVRVAILDSGIDADHKLFEGVSIESFQIAEGDINDVVLGHGTHVASILNAMAPDASILNIKILDDTGKTKISTIMKGIELAWQNGADVINISIGEESLLCPDQHAITSLINKVALSGVSLVCAAGNTGQPHIPASCQNVVAVGSVNKLGKVNKWSGKGPICGDIYPDCVAYGDEILAAAPNNGTQVLSGTSQAAPQASGMLALLRDAVGARITREQVEDYLSQSCQWIETPTKNNSSGWGIIDCDALLKAINTEMNNLY